MPPRKRMDPFVGVEEVDQHVLRAAGVQSNLEDLTEYQLLREKEREKKRIDKKRKRATASSSKGKETASTRPTTPIQDDEFESISATAPGNTVDPAAAAPATFELPAEHEYYPEVENGVGNLLMHETDLPESGAKKMNLRALYNFTIFNPDNNQPVSLMSLWYSKNSYEAYGQVMPELKNGKDQEEDAVPFRTTAILCYNQDYRDQHICIQTQYALYNLKNPSAAYYPLYLPFYMREMAIRLVVRYIMAKRNTTIYEVVARTALLKNDPILRRKWTQKDFEENFPKTTHELRRIVDSMAKVKWEQIENAPLLKSLCPTESSPALSETQEPQTQKKKKNLKIQDTVLTPLVDAFVSNYLDINLEVVGSPSPYFKEEFLNRSRPEDALVDDDSYKAGDFVLVEEEEKRCIAQVVRRHSKNKFHVRWFVHGSETVLGEVAHGQELFLSIDDECRDIRPHNIVSKCKVKRLSMKEYSLQHWPDEDTYFYSSAWSRQNPADFTEVSDKQVEVNVCLTCREKNHPISTIINTPQEACVVIKNTKYHKHDFIKYRTKTPDQLTCSIGQVISFRSTDEEAKVVVRKLDRAEAKRGKVAEFSLYLTYATETIDAAMVIGKCHALHGWIYELKGPYWMLDHPDCFYMYARTDPTSTSGTKKISVDEFKMCTTCFDLYEQRVQKELECKKDRVLKAFDPFIGVGGFGMGLKQGCSMQTIAGVEIDPDAAETARRNFEDEETLIINDDASKILKQFVLQETPSELTKHNIDILYSGPPCQNDSTLNRHKNDERRPLFTALSYVDVLRPPFVVLEFVPGFLQWKASNSQDAEKKLIDACYLKLVLKVMHFLGYNIRGRLMHARAFGVPQTRDRFFIIASSPEYGPLTVPEATHTYNRSKQPGEKERTIYNGLKLKIDTGLGVVPLEVVTVDQAISDLPLFDWANPRDLTPLEEQEREKRIRNDIPAIPCPQTSDSIWGLEDTFFRYTSPPMSIFQRQARWNIYNKKARGPPFQHYTEHFPEQTVQNICDVPIQAGADYRHIPQENLEPTLRESFMSQGRQVFQGGAYSRLDPDGYFHTITTNVGPLAKQSYVLHPHCNRILTVRELARAQGFPDEFTFYAQNNRIKEYHKQIGNSVPFGVSAAIGRAIQELVFKKWGQEHGLVLD